MNHKRKITNVCTKDPRALSPPSTPLSTEKKKARTKQSHLAELVPVDDAVAETFLDRLLEAVTTVNTSRLASADLGGIGAHGKVFPECTQVLTAKHCQSFIHCIPAKHRKVAMEQAQKGVILESTKQKHDDMVGRMVHVLSEDETEWLPGSLVSHSKRGMLWEIMYGEFDSWAHARKVHRACIAADKAGTESPATFSDPVDIVSLEVAGCIKFD